MRETWNSCTHTIEHSGGCILYLSWSQDASHIMCVTDDYVLKTFDSNTGYFVSSVSVEDEDEMAPQDPVLAWSIDKSKIASMGPNRLIVWSCDTGECLQVITADNHGHCCMRAEEKSRNLKRTQGEKEQPGEMCLQEPSEGATRRLPDAVRQHSTRLVCIPSGICWSQDGERVAALRYNKTYGFVNLTVFDLSESQHAHPQSFDLPDSDHYTSGLFWSQYQDRLVLIEPRSPAVSIWDICAQKAIKRFDLHFQTINDDDYKPDFAYFDSPTRQLLATGGHDGPVTLWNLHTEKSYCKLSDPHAQGYTQAIDWSPDGETVATVSEDLAVRVWDSKTGTCLYKLMGSTDDDSRLFWSPDSKRLASSSSSRSGTIRIWEPEITSSLDLSMPDTTHGPVLEISWSPDGVQLAVVHRFLIQIWDTALNTLLSSFEHTGNFGFWGMISWSPNGSLFQGWH